MNVTFAKTEDTLRCVIAPKAPLEIIKFEVSFPQTFAADSRVFPNGYQSWTDSMEYFPDQRMREITPRTLKMLKLFPMTRLGVDRSGDTYFHKFPDKAGVFYGFSYLYVRNGGALTLYGSLSERSGYTIITADANNGKITVSKDLAGKTYTEPTELLSLAVVTGDYDAAFDRWFALMDVACRANRRLTGYTTWYNYYGNITGDSVKRDLDALAAADVKTDIFQIDDGYQTAVGDWLSTDKKKFPAGMQAAAESIHAKGMLAGLWLAPFGAVPRAEVYKQHKDWFVRDKNGNIPKVGPNWGGFCALDIYNEAVRAHLRHVFDVVLNDWGYDLVKLDFLYAAACYPMYNKTRGENLCDAMELLRECCGDKLILGCGVPLMPAFGKADYCRIGADISLDWKLTRFIRECVSTHHAVNNTIFRRGLDGRAFGNDPDVFLLRDNNIKMTAAQRELLTKINSLFGSLVFTSDNVGDYGERQRQIFQRAVDRSDVKILSADYDRTGDITVTYTENGERQSFTFDPVNGLLRD